MLKYVYSTISDLLFSYIVPVVVDFIVSSEKAKYANMCAFNVQHRHNSYQQQIFLAFNGYVRQYYTR